MRRIRRGARTEKGATAIVTALVAIVLFAAAALGVDIANLTMERQELHDAVDAAAHAAAMDLPNTTAATTANTFAKANDPDANPTTVLYCVVAANASNLPTQTQVPSTCDPDGTGGFVGGGWKCQGPICAKPCTTSPNAKCNTVRVEASKDVPYYFAPIIGYEKGSTGVVVSAACKGSCGTEAPNPLDIVIMADRTPSMDDDDRKAMVNGIRNTLTTMDPTMHYVAFGTIHKSIGADTYRDCFLWWCTPYVPSCLAENTKDTTSSDGATIAARRGIWIPVPFSNDYLTSSGTTKTVNPDSSMADALDCVYSGGVRRGPYGTHLSSAMKAAGRYVTGMDTNNLASLPGNRPGSLRKVVIFETDGHPDETYSSGSPNLTDPQDVASTNRQTACDNFAKTAEDVKGKNVIVITIGFGDANSASCSSGKYVRDMLAKAASPGPDGAASSASVCNTDASRIAENADGDYYFCATEGNEMANIFKTAIGQVSGGVRLIRLP